MTRRNTPADFWKRVDIRGPDECWPWTGGRHASGYGSAHFAGKAWHAQRLAYALVRGRPPQHLVVMHSCDNRECCNPAHLSLGTYADNNADMMAKGRHVASPGDKNGARLHPERLTRGEGISTAKLTAEAVLEMRQLRKEGWFFKDIAQAFGVHRSTAHRAVTGRRWAHVKPVAKAILEGKESGDG